MMLDAVDLIYFLLLFIISFCNSSTPPKLLLVSFDGLRYDFLSQQKTPNLWAVSKKGVRYADGIQPMYDTMTAPNHYSMLTGLYEETHGIIGNWFFDPNYNEWYDYWNMTSFKTEAMFNNARSSKWYKGNPIWLLNQDQGGGRASGNMLFPTADANIRQKFVSKSFSLKDAPGQTYDKLAFNYTMWRNCFDNLLKWFKDPVKPINFGMFYIGQPDEIMHMQGLENNGNLSSVLKEVDDLAGYMIERLKAEDLFDSMNIIWTADHGHAQYSYPTDVIAINSYLGIDNPEGDIIWSGDHTIMSKNDHVNMTKVYMNLQSAIVNHSLPLHVWMKNDFPEQYHFHNNDRVGDIIIIPHIGRNIDRKIKDNTQLEREPPHFSSTHGYLPEQMKMHAYLILTGPAFLSNMVERSSPEMIDLFPLMCHVLGIHEIPAHNGTISNLGSVFTSDVSLQRALKMLPSLKGDNLIIFFSIILPTIMFLIFFLVCFLQSPARTNSTGNGSSGYMKLSNQQTQRNNSVSTSNGGALLDKGRADSVSEDEI